MIQDHLFFNKLQSLEVNRLKDWNISYDEFTDKLQMYEPDIFELKKKDIKNFVSGDFRISLNKKTDNLVLLEIKNIHNKTTKSLNNVSKNDIINFVIYCLDKNLKNR